MGINIERGKKRKIDGVSQSLVVITWIGEPVAPAEDLFTGESDRVEPVEPVAMPVKNIGNPLATPWQPEAKEGQKGCQVAKGCQQKENHWQPTKPYENRETDPGCQGLPMLSHTFISEEKGKKEHEEGPGVLVKHENKEVRQNIGNPWQPGKKLALTIKEMWDNMGEFPCDMRDLQHMFKASDTCLRDNLTEGCAIGAEGEAAFICNDTEEQYTWVRNPKWPDGSCQAQDVRGEF
jgi:hypothetical protein